MNSSSKFCNFCNSVFYLKKNDRLCKSFCNVVCRNRYISSKRKTWKPVVVGNCKNCNVEIIAEYRGMDKKDRKFCSYSCVTTYRNTHNNPTNSLEVRQKISISKKKSFDIKGRVTPIKEQIRKSADYINWRNSIYKRDNYACVMCGACGSGVKLNADHIKPFSIFPELVFDLDNGRTLCVQCHRETPTYGRKCPRTKEEYEKIKNT